MLEKNKKDKFKLFSSSKILAIIGFLIIIAISYPLSKNISQQYRINQEIKNLQNEISGLESKNNNLKKLIQFVGSDQFVNEQARLNLNYRKEGEEVLVIKNKEELQGNKQNNGLDQKNISGSNNIASAASEPNISKWFKYFVK